MKKKFIGLFLLLILSVLTFLHSGFKSSSRETDVQLEDVEALSAREGGSSSPRCVVDAGFCVIKNIPQSGMRVK